MKAKLDELLGADLRSLAAMRVGVAIVLILDLCQRAGDLEAHYSDFGLAPRWLVMENLSSRWFFSLHFLSGVWQVQAVLFVAAAVFGLMLLVGYRTRLATVASWLLAVSLDVRNFHVLAGGDMLLRAVLFWSMFLPWGARYSVDYAWAAQSAHERPKRIFSCGTVAFTVQILLLYWGSALSKSGAEWWREGSAVYYAMSIDYVVTPLGHWLLQLPPAMLKLATWGVLAYEFLGPFLFFIPWFNGPVRTLAVFGFIGLHLSILLTLLIGVFPLISIASSLFFLPSWFWDRLAPKFFPMNSKVIALYHDVMTLRPISRTGERLYRLFAVHSSINCVVSAANASNQGNKSQLSKWASVLAVVMTVYVVIWNLGNLNALPFKLSDRFRSIGNIVGLDQAWEMFAPFPAKDDGWYVIPGLLKDGRRVDLYRGGAEIDWRKPRYIAQTIKNHRWRKFFELLNKRKFLAPAYAGYLCRNWNRSHSGSDTLQDLEIIFMVEWTRPNFAYFEPRKLSIGNYQCQSDSAKP